VCSGGLFVSSDTSATAATVDSPASGGAAFEILGQGRDAIVANADIKGEGVGGRGNGCSLCDLGRTLPWPPTVPSVSDA
jgi:hypothetical protein